MLGGWGKLRTLRGETGVATYWMCLGYLGQLIFQLGQFAILARLLGSQDFGRVSYVLAAVAILSPIGGLGFGEVLLVKASQERSQTLIRLKQSLLVNLVMGGFLSVLLVPLVARTLSPETVVLLSLSELVFIRNVQSASKAFQANGFASQTSLLNTAASFVKFSAALVAMIFSLTLFQWSFLQLAFSVVLSAVSYRMVVGRMGGNASRPTIAMMLESLSLSMSFAFGNLAKALYTDLDKILLGIFCSPVQLGVYSAGYKLLSAAFLPVRALLDASAPRQISLAYSCPKECRQFTRKIFAGAIIVSFVLSFTLALTAGLIPWVLGESFRDTSNVVFVGALLPVIQAMHYSFANYLTALGLQWVRTTVQYISLAVYTVVGILTIPTFGWKGAIATCLGAELVLVILFAIAVAMYVRSEDRARQIVAT